MQRTAFFQSATIRKNQLLRDFPELTALTVQGRPSDPFGTSVMHSLELNATKRFSHGLQFTLGYSRMGIRDTDFYLNEFDNQLSTRSSNNGRPHRLVATAVYEMPFGRGKWLAKSGAWNLLFGGWQIAGTYEFQSGRLLDWGNYFYSGDPSQVANVTNKDLNHWFNTANFERVQSNGPGTFHVRVFPTRIEDVREDGTKQINANIQREFRFRERVGVQVRLEALNLQNRSQFQAPDNNPYSTNFGRITQQTQALNRFIQIQGRIVF